jgi:hypothetical protein
VLLDPEAIVQRYLSALEKADHAAMVDLFDEYAHVDSPLYGIQPVDSFYHDLFGNTVMSRIKLLGVFVNKKRPNQLIGYFSYFWQLKDGSRAVFDCIDIFEIDPETQKFRALKIIYDTFHAPPSARQSIPPPAPSNPPGHPSSPPVHPSNPPPFPPNPPPKFSE